MNSSNVLSTPAQRLAGRKLSNGWKVEKLLDRPAGSTGGQFSTSYIVRSSAGERAFLKAIDYTKALSAKDPAKALQSLTAEYLFERNLLEKCRSRNLSRIIRILDSGTIRTDDSDAISIVEYLIFELANGDVRSFVDFGTALDNVWNLRTLHQAAAAVRQLHSMQIAHQDLKPSNMLVFDGSRSKLADLGRAFDFNFGVPHDALDFAGDPTYAPPELLYEHIDPDWRVRRLACDLYLLGSLVVFFYTGFSTTQLLLALLPRKYHFEEWGDGYPAVLPYIQQVFAQLLRVLQQKAPPMLADDIVGSVRELCNPAPERRGRLENISSSESRYSLSRYVTKFDLMATRAELSLERTATDS